MCIYIIFCSQNPQRNFYKKLLSDEKKSGGGGGGAEISGSGKTCPLFEKHLS